MEQIRWKFVMTLAISAMAVSLISGGLGGIPFAVLLIRALTGGLFFAALATGVHLLLLRVFPELFEPGRTERDAPPGSRVNIVMESSGDSEDSVYIQSSADFEGMDTGEEDMSGTSGDLDSFSGAFTAVPDNRSSANAQNDVYEASEGSPEFGQEPEKVAQAVQTVIKRDEKG